MLRTVTRFTCLTTANVPGGYDTPGYIGNNNAQLRKPLYGWFDPNAPDGAGSHRRSDHYPWTGVLRLPRHGNMRILMDVRRTDHCNYSLDCLVHCAIIQNPNTKALNLITQPQHKQPTMKKLIILTAALGLCAAGAFAQGQLTVANTATFVTTNVNGASGNAPSSSSNFKVQLYYQDRCGGFHSPWLRSPLLAGTYHYSRLVGNDGKRPDHLHLPHGGQVRRWHRDHRH